MTLSKTQAARIIETISGLLQESHLARTIDQPVETTTEEFLSMKIGEYSYGLFCRTLEDYIRELNRNMGFAKYSLPEKAGEIISILDHLYDGTFCRGFYGALLDASNANYDGIKLVIERLSISLKPYLRTNYQKWLSFRYLDSIPWKDKCILASFLLRRYGRLLPPPMQNWPADRIAGKLFSSIQLCLES